MTDNATTIMWQVHELKAAAYERAIVALWALMQGVVDPAGLAGPEVDAARTVLTESTRDWTREGGPPLYPGPPPT